MKFQLGNPMICSVSGPGSQQWEAKHLFITRFTFGNHLHLIHTTHILCLCTSGELDEMNGIQIKLLSHSRVHPSVHSFSGAVESNYPQYSNELTKISYFLLRLSLRTGNESRSWNQRENDKNFSSSSSSSVLHNKEVTRVTCDRRPSVEYERNKWMNMNKKNQQVKSWQGHKVIIVQNKYLVQQQTDSEIVKEAEGRGRVTKSSFLRNHKNEEDFRVFLQEIVL